MSWEMLILLVLAVAAFLFVGRILFVILSVLAMAFLIIIGLAIASDLLTGTETLTQIAEQLAPVVALWLAAIANWIKQKINP